MRVEQWAVYAKRVEKFLERLKAGAPFAARAPLRGRCAPSSDPTPFADRLSLAYREIEAGGVWGGAWDSAWFHLAGSVPGTWAGGRVAAHLDFGGEACVFDASGCPLAGLTNGSVFAREFGKDVYALPGDAGPSVELWVEAAANGLFGVALDPDPTPDCPRRHGSYEGRVAAMELVLFDEEVWGLLLDVEVLLSLFQALCPEAARLPNTVMWKSGRPPTGMAPRARRLLDGINRAIDAYADDRRNAARARAVLAPLLRSPADASALEAVAVGHAHIDTGWLWPVRETVRKCARTFASQVDLIQKYPGYVFGASQAQHYLMVKQHYPALYEKIRRCIEEGRWEVQGGMWVEADCNLIDGESMVRQFLHGKNFFRDEFGVEVSNLWLPDVFGYSAALPQIMKKAGVDVLLTQKISWNQFNEFPHHTFRWRGIDGSEVLAHFPPEDTYNSDLLPASLARAESAFKESHLLDGFLCLFGIGDGGGGPKEEHIERGLRMADLEGCPRVRMGRADDFFERLLPRAGELEVWAGELYLELHRGTLTTQARIKRDNRLLERRLREVECLYAALPLEAYPAAELDGLWKTLLLHQFHDILPGSSIRRVIEDTERELGGALAACDRLLTAAAARWGRDEGALTLVNTLACPFRGAVELPASWDGAGAADAGGRLLPAQADAAGTAVFVDLPPCSALTLRKADRAAAAGPEEGLVLENALIRYTFDASGALLSAFDKEWDREWLRSGERGNLLSLYVDRPANWDAWDIDVSYEQERTETARGAGTAHLGAGAVRRGLRFDLAVGASSIRQDVFLYEGSRRLDFRATVQWRERHRMLRVSFPADVSAAEASCHIQFGYVRRPTHRNTSWDMARFESVAHQYVDVSDGDFGAALLNDCKYGVNLHEGVLDMNLLRAPTHPDADADRGEQVFRYAFLPHRGRLEESEVIEEAERFNAPPVVLEGVGEGCWSPPFRLSGEGVSLAALKKAEKEDLLVLRLVESRGRRSVCRLEFDEDTALTPCDLLEWRDEPALEGRCHELRFTPFEIRTFKFRVRR